jgi:hypothetical protein
LIYKGKLEMRYVILVTLIMTLVSCNGKTSTSSLSNEEVTLVTTVKAPSRILLTAVDQEKVEIVRQHMDYGTDPDEYNRPIGLTMMTLKNLEADGAYSLHLAVLRNNEEIVKVLLDNGATVDIRSKSETIATPLHWAAYYCLEDMVSLLIEYGASVNAVDANNVTAVDYALQGQKVGLAMIEDKREEESDPSRLSSGGVGAGSAGEDNSQLWPGCVGSSEGAKEETLVQMEEATSESEERLQDFLSSLKENGGKSGKDL